MTDTQTQRLAAVEDSQRIVALTRANGRAAGISNLLIVAEM